MKKILVPTDFSEISKAALVSATSYARKFSGKIILLHVDHEHEENNIDEKFAEFVNAPELAGVEIITEVASGDAVEEIIQYEADMIFMGARELSGIKGFFTHTTAEQVAKQSECPVITLKQPTNFTQLNSIVYATDMKAEQVEIVDDVKEMQSSYGCHLHILKIYNSTILTRREVEERLKSFAEFNKFEDYSITAIEGSDEGEEIIKFADDIGAQLIMMATHHWSGIGKLLGGYVSSEVLKESRVAVWSKSLPGS